MPPELIKTILAFVEKAQKYTGKTITIKEYLSINKDNFDRHFTTVTHFGFLLEQIAARMSGNKIMIHGKATGYEIHADAIIQFADLAEDEYMILERLSDTVYRKTVLLFSV